MEEPVGKCTIFSKVKSNEGVLTHLSLASFLLDNGKQYNPRCDTAKRGVPSRTILFAKRIFIKQLYEHLKSLLMHIKEKWTHPNDNG